MVTNAAGAVQIVDAIHEKGQIGSLGKCGRGCSTAIPTEDDAEGPAPAKNVMIRISMIT
jgi:hypothetical protein